MATLKKLMSSSALLVLESLSNKLIGLVSTLILARVLLPEDFGIVAIAMLLLGFFDVLAETGMNQYLLRVETLKDEIIHTAWSLNLLIKVTLSLVLVLLSPVLAKLYGDERLVSILIVLAVFMMLLAFRNPGLAYLQRKQEYRAIVKATLVSKVFSVSAAVAIAMIYESYWALIIGTGVNRLFMLFFDYRIHQFRPKFQLKNVKEQWTYSGWVIPQSILGYFRTQLDTLLVSSSFGKDALGSYHVMKYLAFMPGAYLIVPALRPLLVELALVKDDPTNFAKHFNVSLLAVLILAAPISTMMFFFRVDIVLVFLGDNWVSYADLFGLLSTLVLSSTIYHQAGRVMLVNGDTRGMFKYEVISFIGVYSLLIFWVGLSDLLIFTAYRVGLELLFTLGFFAYVVNRYVLKSKLSESFLNIFLVVALSAILGYLAVILGDYFLIYNPLVRLSLKVFIYMVLFTSSSLILFFFMRKFSTTWQDLYLKFEKLVLGK